MSFDQRSGVSHFLGERFFNAGSNECLEVVLQSQEVGLGVHFQQNGGFAVFFQSDSAFSSYVACFLGSLDGAGSTHVINGFFDVAAGLGQGLFAIHHAFAGTLTQFFNQRCSNLCHFKILLDRFSTIPPDQTGDQFFPNLRCRPLHVTNDVAALPTNGFRGGKKGAKPPFCLLSQRQGVNYSAAATGASSTNCSVPPATWLRPRITASAIEPMYSWIARIASSLPGMM